MSGCFFAHPSLTRGRKNKRQKDYKRGGGVIPQLKGKFLAFAVGLTVFAALLFLLPLPTIRAEGNPAPFKWAEFAPEQKGYSVNGSPHAADAAPFIDQNGRLLVPVRFLAHALGVEDQNIHWDGAARTVTLAQPGLPAIEYTVGSARYRILLQDASPEERSMDTAPILEGWRVYLPVRYLAEVLGWGVWWDEKECKVTLVKWEPELSYSFVSRLSDPFYWVAYNPTAYDPESGVWPNEASIRADLVLLRRAGFKGLVTYGFNPALADVPRLARELGFEAVIAGIWNVKNSEELMAAQKAALHIDAFCVGNEGLLTGRYSLDELLAAMEELRRETGKPVTTSEPAHLYFRQSALLRLGDFLLPTVHPYWAGIKDPGAAAGYTAETWRKLADLSGRAVLCKETGLPSAGAEGLSEEAQLEFYRQLCSTGTAFAWFEAFDQTWKVSRPWVNRTPVETHWGLFDDQRRPKAAGRWLLERTGEGLLPSPTEPYVVYSDLYSGGVNAGSDVWIWSGADWGLDPPRLVDDRYNNADAPEGTKCFAVKSGFGHGNYVGWGVFLGTYKNHKFLTPSTVDLSSYKNLEFWVKTPVDLKVEIQQDNPQGRKSTPCLISSYGWNNNAPDVWQKITIPKNAFRNVDLTKIFCPFMITGHGSEITFYVDAVMWK